jgi:hypothetical protein
MWQLDDLITNACAYLPRNLTRVEWEQYIGDALPYQRSAHCQLNPILNHSISEGKCQSRSLLQRSLMQKETCYRKADQQMSETIQYQRKVNIATETSLRTKRPPASAEIKDYSSAYAKIDVRPNTPPRRQEDRAEVKEIRDRHRRRRKQESGRELPGAALPQHCAHGSRRVGSGRDNAGESAGGVGGGSEEDCGEGEGRDEKLKK